MSLEHGPERDELRGGGQSVLSGYLNDRELARELGISVPTLLRWRRLGCAPPVTRFGRRVLTRRSAVEQWLLENETAE